MTTPTVDLVVDGVGHQHTIELVAENIRIAMDSSGAAHLVADLATVIALIAELKGTELVHAPERVEAIEEAEVEHLEQPEVAEPEVTEAEEQEAPARKIKFHRTATGAGKYHADLPGGAKAEIERSGKFGGWMVLLNGQRVTEAPLARIADAKDLVARAVENV